MIKLRKLSLIVSLSCCFLFVAVIAFAQQDISVTGKVTDAGTNLPIANASVAVKGANNRGVISDENGNFKISVPAGVMLVVSSLNYNVQEMKATTQPLSVLLISKTTQLTDVVVIGYGSRQKKDLTGAYGAVGERDISKSTASSPEMSLQGRLAGVQVSSPGGNPNARTNIRIRGVTTMTNAGDFTNDPLYVIDGMPITEGGSGSSDPVVRDVRTGNNPLALLNPNDIESITVLKDASAAALYGVRAGNGVILITTKRGKGKPRIEFNAQYGVQNAVAKGKQLLNTQQFVALYNEAYNNNPSRNGNVVRPIGEVFGPEWNPASPKYLGNSPTYDWQEPFYNNNAPMKNFNLKLLGSTDNLNYYVSGDVNTLEGTLKGAYQDRYTLAANIVSKVSKVIEMGVNIRGVYSKAENGFGGTNVGLAVSPWQPIYGNGPGGYAPNAYVDSFTFNGNNTNPADDWNPKLETTNPPYYSWVSGGKSAPAQLYGLQTKGNPFTALNRDLGYSEFNNYRAIGNAYLQVSPIRGLKIKGSLYGDYFNDIQLGVSTFDTWVFGSTPSNPYEGVIKKYDTTMIGNLGTRNRVNKSYTTELTAIYNTTFGSAHSLEITGIANRQTWDWGLSSSTGLINTLNPNRYNVSNASNLHNGGGYKQSWEGVRTLIGYRGRISYKYADRYYLDITVGRDGSSRFAPGHRWGTFPAVAAAWRITGEKFMQGAGLMSWLTDLKLRANWGQLGKETTNGWKYLSIVNPGISMPNYAFGSGNGNSLGSQQTGAYLPDFANTDLSWEKVTTSGVGIDASMFKNKLNVTVEYFKRLTTGMIQQVPAPYSSGIQSSIDLNVGEMQNTGVEFSAGYNTKAGAVNLGFNGNLTVLSNKVTALYKGINLGDTYEGYSFGYIRGYKVGGIFQNQAEIDAWRAKYRDAIAGQSATDLAAGAYSPGDMWFQDLGAASTTAGKLNPNKDSVINDNDRVYLGKVIPGVVYGFGLNAGYANFEFSVFFRGEADVQRINNVKWAGESMSSNGSGQLATVLNRWTPTNPSATMPRAVYNDPRQNSRFSDRWVENAGYMRMQNIQLSYRVPANIIGKTGFVQGIRLYVMGTNLFTVTNYTGIDPENDYNPQARQVIVGLNASF